MGKANMALTRLPAQALLLQVSTLVIDIDPIPHSTGHAC